ncbi:MAG: sialidase family protein [Planctomycetota bacterium]
MSENDMRILVCPTSGANGRNDSASVVALADGRVLLAWSEYTSASGADVAPCRISGIYSSDEGRTWSKRAMLQEGHEGGSAYSAALAIMGNGDVGLFYMHCDRKEGSYDDETGVHVRWKRSADSGKTWSDPARLSERREPGGTLLHNDRVVRVSTGRVIAPVTVVRVRPGQLNYEGVFCYWSNDDGKTWRRAEQEVATPGDPRGSCEPCVIELADRRLLMLLRDSSGVLHKCHSADFGETWTTPLPTDLPSYNSPMMVKRIPETGDLCLIFNQASPQEVVHNLARVRLTAAISKDEGETWPLRKNLVENPADRRAHVEVPDKLFYRRIDEDRSTRLGAELAAWRRLAEHGSPESPIYSHSSYPSLMFRNGKAFITYDACSRRSPEDAPTGLVLRALPVSWFYA